MKFLVSRFIVLLCLLSPGLALAASPMIAAGYVHNIALKSDGTVVAWGDNSFGQLGDGTTTNRSNPVPVAGLTGVVAIAAGQSHSIALKSDGTLVAWGDNSLGQLGDGTLTNRSTPVPVVGITGVVAIAGGQGHSVARMADNSVMAWGANPVGQVGDGTNFYRTSPVAVINLGGVAAIATGQGHNIALKSDGTVMAWGYNLQGQLGDGTNTNRNSPVGLIGLNGVVSGAAGSNHSIVVKSDGTAMAWGYNNNGQLGDGTSTSRSSPVSVSGLTGILAAAAGQQTSFALKSDGSVVAWGGNTFGALGDGTTTNRSSPVVVVGLSGVVSISAGSLHGIALKADGTVKAWGYNNAGQLGDGTTTNRTSAVTVAGLNLGVAPTPPVLTAGPTVMSGPTHNSVTYSVSYNEPGHVYTIVVPAAATAPTAAQVKASVDYGSVSVLMHFDTAMLGSTPTTLMASFPSPSTAYKVYFVAEDSDGNLQTTPSSLAVTTTAAGNTLTVIGSGAGTGTVTSVDNSGNSDGRIGCTITAGSASGTCNSTEALNATVTLVPTAAAGSSFAGWSGPCEASSIASFSRTVCVVSMSAAQFVTAWFHIAETDADGDGLPDSWESANSVGGVSLSEADGQPSAVGKKDVYLWVDVLPVTTSGGVDQYSLLSSNQTKKIVDIFALHGVNLHVKLNFITRFNASILENSVRSDSITSGLKSYKEAFGFYTVNNQSSRIRESIYHYVLFGDVFCGIEKDLPCELSKSNGVTGQANGRNNAIFISGRNTHSANMNDVGRAGTIMHELGHTLGLGHGGPVYSFANGIANTLTPRMDSLYTNDKPNYLSVMNYLFQVAGLTVNNNELKVDYASVKYDDIDEINASAYDARRRQYMANNAQYGPVNPIAVENATYGTIQRCGYPSNNSGLEPVRDIPIANIVNFNPGLVYDNSTSCANFYIPAITVMPFVDVNSNKLRDTDANNVSRLKSNTDWDHLMYSITGTGSGYGAIAGVALPDFTALHSIEEGISEPSLEAIYRPSNYQSLLHVFRSERNVVIGSVVRHQLSLTNSGKLADTYDLSFTVGAGWTTTLSIPSTVILSPGETKYFFATSNVPPGAALGENTHLLLAATSRADASTASADTWMIVDTVATVDAGTDGDGDGLLDVYDPNRNQPATLQVNAFGFAPVVNASLSGWYNSAAVTVAGSSMPVAIAISGGTYSINGGAFTGLPGNVAAGQTVVVRGQAASTYSTNVSVVVNIGGTVGSFNVTTMAAVVVAPPSSSNPVLASTAIPLLAIPATCGLTIWPQILDMGAGGGPAFAADMVSILSSALGMPLRYVEQTPCGTVTLAGFNGGTLSFTTLSLLAGDPRANGVYSMGNGQYQVVRAGQSLVIAPAVVHLEQLAALLPGLIASQADNGVITATFNGLTYVVQPGVGVQLNTATGVAGLLVGSDGNIRFIDTVGNNQLLYPAFAELATLRNILRGLDVTATLNIQLDGTATIEFIGQRYTLVPDLTLSSIPPERTGQAWWQESDVRYRFVNSQPVGTTQGFTVKP